MSTLIESHQITLDADLTEEQIPALREETGATCWLVTGDKILVESSTTEPAVDLSGVFSALISRGVRATTSLLVSRMFIPS